MRRIILQRMRGLFAQFIILAALAAILIAIAPNPLAAQSAACSSPYTVKKNDSWFKIANRCGVSFDALRQQNQALWQRRGRVIQPGDQMVIPSNGVPVFQSQWGAGSLEQEITPTSDVASCAQIAAVLDELISGAHAYLYTQNAEGEIEEIADPQNYLLWLDNGSATFGIGWAFRVDDAARLCPQLTAGLLAVVTSEAGSNKTPKDDGPQTAVSAYYELIADGLSDGNLRPAYALFSEARQARQSYNAWRRLYSPTTAIRLDSLHLSSQTPNRAVVRAEVTTRDRVGDALVDIAYEVVIDLALEDGEWRLDRSNVTELARTAVEKDE